MKTLQIAAVFFCVAFAYAYTDFENSAFESQNDYVALDDPAYPLFDANREKRQVNFGLGVGPFGVNVGVGNPYYSGQYYGRPYYGRPYYGYNNHGYNNYYGGHNHVYGAYRPYRPAYYY